MSDRKPHVTDVELGVIASRATSEWELMTIVRDEYEVKVAKDAKLIQRLIREGSAMAALIEVNEHFIESDERREHWHSHRVSWNAALAAADAHGFKPTEL